MIAKLPKPSIVFNDIFDVLGELEFNIFEGPLAKHVDDTLARYSWPDFSVLIDSFVLESVHEPWLSEGTIDH